MTKQVFPKSSFFLKIYFFECEHLKEKSEWDIEKSTF